MFQPVRISPSILSADFMNMQRSVSALEKGGAGFVHVDVMDGHFVPNLTIGVPFVRQLGKVTNLPLDVHLMIDNPLTQLPWYLDAGCDIVTVHAEAFDSLEDTRRAISMIHEAGVRAAISVKPKTDVAVLGDVIASLDMVLVMSVEPGFSGQSYIPGSDVKVAQVVELARSVGCAPLIEVDGGINAKTAPLVCAAGADVLVCGNAVCGAKDPALAISEITTAARKGLQ